MKFTVIFPVFATTVVEVEADSARDAIEVAAQSVDVSLCYACSRTVETDAGINEDKATVLDDEGNELIVDGKPLKGRKGGAS